MNFEGKTAREQGLAGCHVCGAITSTKKHLCNCCGISLHSRKTNSVQRTWALALAATALYIPAMIFPFMIYRKFDQPSSSTVIEGVMVFLEHGSYMIALVIFVASVAIPILKLLAIMHLLNNVRTLRKNNLKQLTKLYRMAELVGKWSMVDVFVVAIMVALVQAGSLLTIEPGMGLIPFSGVVILTMLAAMQFDTRLLWDKTTSIQSGNKPG